MVVVVVTDVEVVGVKVVLVVLVEGVVVVLPDVVVVVVEVPDEEQAAEKTNSKINPRNINCFTRIINLSLDVLFICIFANSVS